MLGRHFSNFFGLLVSVGKLFDGPGSNGFPTFYELVVSFIGAVCNFYVGFRNNMFSRGKKILNLEQRESLTRTLPL